MWANDDLFAEKENLIKPGAAEFRPATFGHKGQVYDGWETRRRRGATGDARDSAIVRLGVPGIVRGVVVDTAWFTGNYPPEISVEAAYLQVIRRSRSWSTRPSGRRSSSAVRSTATPATRSRSTPTGAGRTSGCRCIPTAASPGSACTARVCWTRGSPTGCRWTWPALENGGRITACSNMFYGSPNNLLLPGTARTMGEGWETSRRRDTGNDWVQVHLASQGLLNAAEFDTSYFIGNAPGTARLSGRDGDGDWFELLPTTELQPDTRHRFLIDDDRPVTEARLDIHPDGGMARLRLFGTLTPEGLRRIQENWDASGA